MKSNWIGMTALALALAASLALPATAQPVGGGPRGRRGHFMRGGGPGLLRILKKLDLSDEQKSQIREIVKKHRPEFIGIVKELRNKHRALADLATADRVDEAAIRDAAGDMADAIAEGALLRAKVRSEVKPILTPEQLEEWDAFRQGVRKRVDEFLDEAEEE